jgi:hypothetical protein
MQAALCASTETQPVRASMVAPGSVTRKADGQLSSIAVKVRSLRSPGPAT